MKFDGETSFLTAFNDEHGSSFGPASGITARARRLALIGCFRPRQCGIATFTADVYDHLRATRPDLAIDIYAMRLRGNDASDPAAVAGIDEGDSNAYRAAAEAINASGADAVWLQHEFGIFGGPAGDMILGLVDRIAAPLIVTFHTILAEPGPDQRRVMEHLVAKAAKLVVMSAFGRDTLVGVYGAKPERIELIEHGTPDRPFVERSLLRASLGLGDRPIMSTFGLIGPGKGLEAAIRALPAIAAQYPDILYRIVGATHPNLVTAEGEAYRNSLVALAEELGVADNIAWENRFLDLPDLLEQIELCDIYLAPYPNLAQITSGTLAYAVALGRAVVATPFVHARELLADEVGILLPAAESEAISEAALLLLAHPDERRALQARAYARGRRTAWPEIARSFAALVEEVATVPGHREPRRMFPAFGAIRALSDDVGILQHGAGLVPDRNHGYCIDDNARALMLVNASPSIGDEEYGLLFARYAAFLRHGWNADRGVFRNFMSYDRRWLEEEGSEDSNGRTLWALGHGAAHGRSRAHADWCAGLFSQTAALAAELKSPRAIAFALLGADELLARYSGNAAALAIVERGGALLHALWKSARRTSWDWFEPMLAYDNARLAEALMRAGRRLASVPIEEAGIAALDWLCDIQTSEAGHFRPMGCEGFGAAGELFPFDQQPLEAWATIDACATAYRLSGKLRWHDRAERAYGWFLGANDRGAVIASSATGRCCDGLTRHGVNSNVGAESVLAFHLAHRAMADTFWARGTAKDTGANDVDLQSEPYAAQYPS
ncbi:glycosyltransferase family 4 protein [Sphingopyxis sp. JAI128]|uniref:glycosyltransferase family 4 protein n=1 Tax=Sphingopyxis sp. JAI128 TaxID=2723066 RepID=UPI00161A35A5|nr:glycosyltransferase family 4 protein [Sphingopyxis sp. JAI128]MBB6425370.1 glycosyltransferase involved in cell wall biosynthesis [Sphingopyxis sp. JAI128]